MHTPVRAARTPWKVSRESAGLTNPEVRTRPDSEICSERLLWPILTQSKGIRPVKVRFHTAKTHLRHRRVKTFAVQTLTLPAYSITSSARSRIDCGTVRP